MKKLFLMTLSLLLLISGGGYSQKIMRQSINSFGNAGSFSNVAVSQTVGQSSLTGTKILEDGKVIRQGFQQPLSSTRTIYHSEIELTLSVYPNPFQDVIYIELGGEEIPVVFNMSNMLGQIIFEDNILSNAKYSYNFSDLAPGVYFVNVYKQSDMSNLVTKKITKTF